MVPAPSPAASAAVAAAAAAGAAEEPAGAEGVLVLPHHAHEK